jgi:hypothetical protein
LPDLLHHRQRAISTTADYQPATSPGDVLRSRERGVTVHPPELPGGAAFFRLRIFPRSMIRS